MTEFSYHTNSFFLSFFTRVLVQIIMNTFFDSLKEDLQAIARGILPEIMECVLEVREFKLLRGSLNKFPDFFRMGTFIDSTHMKLWSSSK